MYEANRPFALTDHMVQTPPMGHRIIIIIIIIIIIAIM